MVLWLDRSGLGQIAESFRLSSVLLMIKCLQLLVVDLLLLRRQVSHSVCV